MENIWKCCLKFSWLIIFLLIVLTVFFFAWQFRHVKFQNKFTSWLPQEDQVV